MINVVPLEQDTSVENTIYFNRGTQLAPSRATLEQNPDNFRQGALSSMADLIKIDNKGSSPKSMVSR